MVHHGPEYRQTTHIPVIKDFYDFRFLIAEAEVGFIKNQGALECIECVEYGGNSTGAARKERVVTERTNC